MASSEGVESNPIVRAGVVGAGQMGGGIAATLLRAGIATTLVDVSTALLESAAARVNRIAASSGGEAPGNRDDEAPAHPLLSVSTELTTLGREDLIIEAIIEDEASKAALFESLGRIVRRDAILASNTSTIPISRLARSVPDPARFAGMHFFHPVRRMKLVEIIRGEQSAEATISRLVELSRKLEKVPIVVGDGPGFFTTRVLSAYIVQSMRLVDEGISLDAIDDAAVRFGLPMGPIALIDLIGLDTTLSIARVMAQAFPDRFQVSRTLENLVAAGKLGRKSGSGFRSYSPGGTSTGGMPKPETAEPTVAAAITDRLILPMLLESIRILEEGLVANPRDIDTGMMLGLGFPASTGGLMSWCDTLGTAVILERLNRYSTLGPAFSPPALLTRLGGTGAKIVGDG